MNYLKKIFRNYYDIKVYFTFLITGFAAFIFYIIDITNRKEVILNYSFPETVVAGDIVKFTDQTEGAESWEWDFGDYYHSSIEQNPQYIYKNAGEYTITLSVNEEVYGEKKIIVKPQPVPIKRVIPVAEWNPRSVKAGEKIYFKDKTPGAIAWNWQFDEDGNTSADRQTDFTFLDEGTKTVRLKVTGADFTGEATYEIEVFKKTPIYTSHGTRERERHTDKTSRVSTPGNFIKIEWAGIPRNFKKDLCPDLYEGDYEFRGHIKIYGHVDFEISPDRKKITAAVTAFYIENGGKRDTKAKIDGKSPLGKIPLYTAPLRKKILWAQTDTIGETFDFMPPANTHTLMSKDYNSFVRKIEVIGDVIGKDLPCDRSKNKSLFSIYFNDFQVVLIDE